MIALLLFLAAGTHTPVPAAAPRPVKPLTACLAVTRADVQLALGRAVTIGQEAHAADQSTCDYTSPHGQVTVTVQHLAAEPDLPVEIAALQREIEGSTVRAAVALGARAFFLDIAGAGTQLHILRGRDYLLISVLGFGDAPHVSAAAENIARAAIARM